MHSTTLAAYQRSPAATLVPARRSVCLVRAGCSPNDDSPLACLHAFRQLSGLKAHVARLSVCLVRAGCSPNDDGPLLQRFRVWTVDVPRLSVCLVRAGCSPNDDSFSAQRSRIKAKGVRDCRFSRTVSLWSKEVADLTMPSPGSWLRMWCLTNQVVPPLFFTGRCYWWL